jgi:hypothetical protein
MFLGIGLGTSAARLAASSWTPGSLSHLVAWYRSDNVTQSAGAVSAWPDKSGNSHPASQASGVLQPNYSASGGVNGRPYLWGTGGAGQTSLAATLPLLSQPFEIIVVAATGTTATSGYLYDCGSNQCVALLGAGPAVSLYNGSTSPSVAVAASTLYSFDTVFNGASSSIALNGGAATTGSPGAGAVTTTFTIGNFGGGVSSFAYQGPMYEVIVNSALLTGAEQTNLQAYLTSLYGVA